jgi:hypothetical protein
MSEKIVIVFSPDGSVKVEAKGFHGAGCMEASRAIEEAIGAVGNISRTGEYYDEEVKEVVKLKNGNH